MVSIEERVAIAEVHIENVRDDIGDIKADVGVVRRKVDDVHSMLIEDRSHRAGAHWALAKVATVASAITGTFVILAEKFFR